MWKSLTRTRYDFGGKRERMTMTDGNDTTTYQGEEAVEVVLEATDDCTAIAEADMDVLEGLRTFLEQCDVSEGEILETLFIWYDVLREESFSLQEADEATLRDAESDVSAGDRDQYRHAVEHLLKYREQN